jgi:hypothetical protein
MVYPNENLKLHSDFTLLFVLFFFWLILSQCPNFFLPFIPSRGACLPYCWKLLNSLRTSEYRILESVVGYLSVLKHLYFYRTSVISSPTPVSERYRPRQSHVKLCSSSTQFHEHLLWHNIQWNRKALPPPIKGKEIQYFREYWKKFHDSVRSQLDEYKEHLSHGNNRTGFQSHPLIRLWWSSVFCDILLYKMTITEFNSDFSDALSHNHESLKFPRTVKAFTFV